MSEQNELEVKNTMSRRGFLKAGGLAMGTVALGITAGCGDKITKVVKTDSTTSSTEKLWYGVEPAIGEIVEEITTDILICGAGHGGMNAALSSSYLGAKTLVIEKNPFRGMMKTYVGLVGSKPQIAAGVTIDKAEIVNELLRHSGYKADIKLLQMWVNESGATGDFMAEQIASAGFKHVAEYDLTPGGYHGNFKEYAVHTKFVIPGEEVVGNSGVEDAVVAAAEKMGAVFRYSTPMVKLIKNSSGKITGAYAKNDKGYIKITATKGVLLCTGGYAADGALVQKLNPHGANMVMQPTNWPGTTADGIKAGIWVGGVKQEEPGAMIFDRGAAKPGVKGGYPFQVEGTGLMYTPGSQPFLKVLSTGERFCNESSPYDWPLFASEAREGTSNYCMLFDADYWDNVTEFHTIGCSRMLPSAAVPKTGEGYGKEWYDQEIQNYLDMGVMMKANTIEELATKLKLPTATLVATVERYNSMAEAGVDSDFGRPARDMFPMAKAPFYGINLGGTLLTTMDGLLVNEHCQLVDAKNNVIEGVYVAGDCGGGFFGKSYPELIVGCACGHTMTQARHAVRHALGKL